MSRLLTSPACAGGCRASWRGGRGVPPQVVTLRVLRLWRGPHPNPPPRAREGEAQRGGRSASGRGRSLRLVEGVERRRVVDQDAGTGALIGRPFAHQIEQ